jgi:hypothetical protein
MANKRAIGMNIMVEEPLDLSCFRQLNDIRANFQAAPKGLAEFLRIACC